MSRVFHRSLRQSYATAAAGDGPYLIDYAGKRYLDGSGGAAVSCLGHGHPAVVEAVREQVARLEYAHTSFFTSEPAEALAEALIAHAPVGLSHVYFVSGGSEAVEAALKMAVQYFGEIGKPQKKHEPHRHPACAQAGGHRARHRDHRKGAGRGLSADRRSAGQPAYRGSDPEWIGIFPARTHLPRTPGRLCGGSCGAARDPGRRIAAAGGGVRRTARHLAARTAGSASGCRRPARAVPRYRVGGRPGEQSTTRSGATGACPHQECCHVQRIAMLSDGRHHRRRKGRAYPARSAVCTDRRAVGGTGGQDGASHCDVLPAQLSGA